METKRTRPKRLTGIQVPENKAKTQKNTASETDETADEKIARLEKKLEDARLRADLYDEIINVAERKFDMQIRKKPASSDPQPECTVPQELSDRETVQIARCK